MNFIKTDFYISTVLAIQGGWIANSWHPTNSNSQFLHPDGSYKATQWKNVTWDRGILRGKNDQGYNWLDKDLNLTTQENSQEYNPNKKFKLKIIPSNYDDLINTALGINDNEFGIIIKNQEDNRHSVIGFDKQKYFPNPNSTTLFNAAFSQDGLTIIIFQFNGKNFILLDNPLL